MMNKKYFFGLALVFIILVSAYVFFTGSANAPTAGEEKQTSGTFSYINASNDLIVVNSLKPGDVVGNTFTIAGMARGYWFFEASFPIEIQDSNGNTLAITVAQAEGEWMTEEFVPFTAQVNLTTPYSGQAIVVLKKDNPSGEPQNDASVSFPVVAR
ncbi:Gmad2 immunoglobulin-like domain-containing protein [Patescibacteria group bacterium]|nr:Gmad2 immunoglobulin-like domain-containing protein [Patescibacteria group bacterium]